MSASAVIQRTGVETGLGCAGRPGLAEPCGAGGFYRGDAKWGQEAMPLPEPQHGHPSGPATSAPNVSLSPTGVAKDVTPPHSPPEHPEGSYFGLSPNALPQPSTRTPLSPASRHETCDSEDSEVSRESCGSSRRSSSAGTISLRRKKTPTGKVRKTSMTPRRFAGGGVGESVFARASSVDVQNLTQMLGSSMSRLESLETDKMDRYERYKHEAIEHGLKLMEEERKRSDQEHNILVKRIEFLTKELEEARRSQIAKTRECEELLEVAEELARDRRFGDDISIVSETSTAPRNWLQSPETSMNASPDKGSGGKRECRVCGVGSIFASLGF